MTIILSLLMVLIQPMQSQEVLTTAQQANAFYDSGEYDTARELYESLIDGGIQDSAIYINLGNTHVQQQALAEALLNYRRAQTIAPRDPQLNASLARIRSIRTDVQGDETALVDSMAALTIAAMTSRELHWATLGLWSLFYALLLAAIARPGWRDQLRGPLIVLGMLLLFGLALWVSRIYADQYRPVAVVMANNVQVMSGPDDTYLKIYELHTAAEVRILERHDGWIRFILPDQQQGWIRVDVIEKV